jgi:hypothetical protein
MEEKEQASNDHSNKGIFILFLNLFIGNICMSKTTFKTNLVISNLD